jgi:pimeloyl-ACP methyl ester carboxylesterase
MNDVGAFLPIDALRYIGRNLDAPARFASLDEVEAHMRHTHREWGDLSDAQWRQLAMHGAHPVEDGFRLHYDPRIARLLGAPAFVPGLYFWDAWYRVKCPVLLVRGETSAVFPRSVARTMLEIKPSAELVEIPDCGHAPALMSAPEIGIVREFLAARSARMPRAWRTTSPTFPSWKPAS